ncbi:hypothetical protein GOP47_0016055, partial [Adiantum capillus-veneris]
EEESFNVVGNYPERERERERERESLSRENMLLRAEDSVECPSNCSVRACVSCSVLRAQHQYFLYSRSLISSSEAGKYALFIPGFAMHKLARLHGACAISPHMAAKDNHGI